MNSADDLASVYLAMRGHGAQSIDKIRERTERIGTANIEVCIATLCQLGWAAPVGRGLARQYADARTARQMNRVLEHA
jgi:hypothetical protein